MQIESQFLAAGMMSAFFDSNVYENAPAPVKATMRTMVMKGYEIACSMQAISDAEQEREKELAAIEKELDFILHICDQLKRNPINSNSINLLIGSLPCECDHRDLMLNYTGDSAAVTDFLLRLLGRKYQGHVYDTFRSLRSNPYVNGPDSVLLLLVGLSQHGFNLKQEFT